MKHVETCLFIFCGLALTNLGTMPHAQAQQTVFNVPSAEVSPQGRLFLQHESQFRPWARGRFITNTEYSAYGLGHHTELDITMFNINSPPTDNISLGLGFKSVIPILQKRLAERRIKLTAGSVLPISLQGEGVGNWSYSHLSFRVPKLKTRITSGVSVGTRQIFGRNTVNFIGAYEQPVTKRLSLQGDWYSGTHNLGFLINGISYALPKETILYVGYQIPNTPRCGRQGLVIELSKLF